MWVGSNTYKCRVELLLKRILACLHFKNPSKPNPVNCIACRGHLYQIIKNDFSDTLWHWPELDCCCKIYN